MIGRVNLLKIIAKSCRWAFETFRCHVLSFAKEYRQESKSVGGVVCDLKCFCRRNAGFSARRHDVVTVGAQAPDVDAMKLSVLPAIIVASSPKA